MKSLFRFPYPTLLWTLAVLLLTLTPSDKMPETPQWQLLSFDTAAHAGVFALLAALAYPWVRTWSSRPLLLVLLGSVALGAAIEGLQYAMHLGRHAEWTDLLSDAIGTVLVLAGVALGRRRLAATAVLALAALAVQAQNVPDMARARKTIETLASPKLHGRGYVRQGEHKAAAYLRGRLRQLGLQPLAPDYTQPFTLDVNTFPGKMKLRLRTANAVGANSTEVELQAGTDFTAAPSSAAISSKGPLPIVVFDTLTFTRYDPLIHLSGSQGSPQLALVLRQQDETRLHLPENAPLLAAWESRSHLRIVLVNKLTASLAAQQDKVAIVEVLASKWPLKNLLDTRGDNAVIQLDAKILRDYPTQNLAAVVRGSAQPDSFVVVTAHYDHLGMMGRHTYFPGANDNASGVALLLELAAHYARPENRPRCSVAFLLFGAEEAGLVGSRYFVQHPLLPLGSIKFLVNLDLLGTGEEGATVVNGKVYEAAYRQLTALNEAHHYLPRLTARGPAANSDHFPFSEAGVPAFFLYTRGGSKAYHDVQDQPGALSLAGFAGAYGLVRDFLDARGAK